MVPVILPLIAEHPELIAVASCFGEIIMRTNAVAETSTTTTITEQSAGAAAGGAAAAASGHCGSHRQRRTGRASRDVNWRHAAGLPSLVTEHLRHWTGKIVDTANDVATHVHETVHEVATGEQARAKEDEANLKKAIAESVETLEEDKLVRRAISESLSETEEESPKMKEQSSPKKKKNPLPQKIAAAAAIVTKNQEDPDNAIAAKIVKVVRKNVLKARFVKDREGRHPTMFPG